MRWKLLIWAALAVAVVVPLAAAAASPLLAWRGPAYIAAGFAGIVALSLMLVQPLLMGAYLPGVSARQGRRLHGWVGGLLSAAIVVHVGGLWITSPPDVMDALLFASPTPFSAWGVVAMWAVVIVVIVAVFRRWLRVSPRNWRLLHLTLAVVIVTGTVVHGLLIEGTMEPLSKAALCVLLCVATLKVMADLRHRTRTSPTR